MRPMEFAKRTVANKAIDYFMEDPVPRIESMMATVNKMLPDALFPSQRKPFNKAFVERNTWYQNNCRVADLDPDVATGLLKCFLTEANLVAWDKQEKSREKYQCNIPWAVLLDPTSACNLHCTGCWAAEYGHKLNLSYDDIDSIINQANELGTHVFIYTGGEPLVRKVDLIRLCEAHPDSAFLCFTNATLIDQAFVEEVARVKNFVPIISAEGNEQTTDARRGEGTYQKIDSAMDLLKARGVPFGVSLWDTSQNAGAGCTAA